MIQTIFWQMIIKIKKIEHIYVFQVYSGKSKQIAPDYSKVSLGKGLLVSKHIFFTYNVHYNTPFQLHLQDKFYEKSI